MFEPMELTNDAVIKVIGVGGGGGNAVEHMVRERIEGVEFFAVNTDAQALRKTAVGQTIQIGSGITKGLGAGANPEVGRNSAEEDREALRAALDGADMVFIAAGMGGGTGTGAAPVVAEVAKDLGILTVAVVTKPFNFEGKKRMAFAEQGIAELSKHVDSLITIPNDKLLKVLGRGISLLDAFGAANDLTHGQATIHRRLLNPAEGLGLAHPHVLHEQTLRAVHALTGLEAIRQIGNLILQRLDLCVPRQGDLDGRDQVSRAEGLDDVGHGASVAGTLDELRLRERRQHDDGAGQLLQDLLRSGDAVHLRHFDIHHAQIGLKLECQLDSFLTVGSLANDLEPRLGQRLNDIETNQPLVFCDEDATRFSLLFTHCHIPQFDRFA